MTIPFKSQWLAQEHQSDPDTDDDKFPSQWRKILIPLAQDATLTDTTAHRRSQYELWLNLQEKVIHLKF